MSVTLCFAGIGGEDYIPLVEEELVFAFGFESRQCVRIPIISDNCIERMESFNVSLSSEQDCVFFDNREVQVYIIEDEGMFRVHLHAMV